MFPRKTYHIVAETFCVLNSDYSFLTSDETFEQRWHNTISNQYLTKVKEGRRCKPLKGVSQPMGLRSFIENSGSISLFISKIPKVYDFLFWVSTVGLSCIPQIQRCVRTATSSIVQRSVGLGMPNVTTPERVFYRHWQPTAESVSLNSNLQTLRQRSPVRRITMCVRSEAQHGKIKQTCIECLFWPVLVKKLPKLPFIRALINTFMDFQ